MKKLYYCIVLFLLTLYSNAQEPMIMTFEAEGPTVYWRTVTLSTSYPNSMTVDFGDGTILSNQTGVVSHTYSTSGIYTVTVSGNLGNLYLGHDQTNQKLRTVEQWGDIQWTSMTMMFYGCPDLTINATDTPDLSQVTSLSDMFSNCPTFNSPLNNWDVSTITDMSNLFLNATAFNQPLDNWNMSNVTTLNGMFNGASSFNQSINSWDVSNVTDIFWIFHGATSFNQPLDNWDVSAVTEMQGAFYEASSFNQPIDDWDVSNVEDFYALFYGATSFNQPLNNWNISNATNLDSMFSGATSFNQPLNNWDVSNVESLTSMFSGATAFNQPLNEWDVSSVTSMTATFYNATTFNQPLDNWNVSNVEYMSHLFSNATSFNQPLNSWDVSSVVMMYNTFADATSFNQPLDNWNVSNVTSTSGMFHNATSFNQDLSSWDFNPAIDFGFTYDNITYSFLRNTALTIENYEALLLSLIDEDVQVKYMGVHGLEYCDSGLRTYLTTELGWNLVGDSLGEECVGNTLSGTVYFDEDGNGCDNSDLPISTLIISGNNGTFTSGTATNIQGNYDLTLQADSYEISILNLPSYFTATPATPNISFTGFGSTESLNFCITANEAVNDLSITLLPISDARPGFEATYQLVASNIGTQTISNATVNLSYDVALQTFVSASETADTFTTGQLGFGITTLQPFETKVIDVVMQTMAPPVVNGDDILNFTATITPDTGDNTPSDNVFEFIQTVVNSFDPNDKRVVQGNEIQIEQADDYLDYIIRFQNTGTASAITVRIEDELSDMLDWSTFTPLSSSHDYTIRITDGSHVEFLFNNINLPAQQDNDAGSNGYIAYKIKPIQDVTIGDIINGNEALIFFDYNLPIITNSLTTEIVAPTAGIGDFNQSTEILIYPNPATDILYILPQNGLIIEKVKLYNQQGRELVNLSNTDSIILNDLSHGIYLLSVQTNQSTVQYKIIKN